MLIKLNLYVRIWPFIIVVGGGVAISARAALLRYRSLAHTTHTHTPIIILFGSNEFVKCVICKCVFSVIYLLRGGIKSKQCRFLLAHLNQMPKNHGQNEDLRSAD